MQPVTDAPSGEERFTVIQGAGLMAIAAISTVLAVSVLGGAGQDRVLGHDSSAPSMVQPAPPRPVADVYPGATQGGSPVSSSGTTQSVTGMASTISPTAAGAVVTPTYVGPPSNMGHQGVPLGTSAVAGLVTTSTAPFRSSMTVTSPATAPSLGGGLASSVQRSADLGTQGQVSTTGQGAGSASQPAATTGTPALSPTLAQPSSGGPATTSYVPTADAVAAELAAEGHPLSGPIPTVNPNGGTEPAVAAALGLPTDFVYGSAPDPWISVAAATAYQQAGSYTAWIAEGAPGSGWTADQIAAARANGNSLDGGAPITRVGWGG